MTKISNKICDESIFNNYWTRLTLIIAIIIKAQVWVICRRQRLRRIDNYRYHAKTESNNFYFYYAFKTLIHNFGQRNPYRDLTQSTTATATRTSPSKRFNEQYNGSARALYILVHFFAVLRKIGSISAALSSPVFVQFPELRAFGEMSVGSFSRTAAGNRAYLPNSNVKWPNSKHFGERVPRRLIFPISAIWIRIERFSNLFSWS